MIGSPSFTSSLIIIPMIPLSVISGFFGGVLGYAIEAIIKLIKKRNVLQKKETLITALLLSIIVFGLAIFVPLKLQLVWKAHNSPHIIVDTGFIKKISYNSNSNIQNINGLSQCIINFEQRYAGKQLFWNGKAFRVVFDEHQFSVLDETGKTFITQLLEGFDYIRELSCFPFDTGLSQVLQIGLRNKTLHFQTAIAYLSICFMADKNSSFPTLDSTLNFFFSFPSLPIKTIVGTPTT